MRISRALSVLLLVAALAAAASAGVTVDYKKSADFAGYRTFDWDQGTPAFDPAIEKQIRSAVEGQLVAKGLSKVSSRPDVLVRVMSRDRQGSVQDMDILGRYPGFDDTRSGGPSNLEEREVQLGDLVVVLLDGQTTLQVWQAVGSRIFQQNPEKAGKKIQKMVERMFRDYPPR